MIDVKSDDKENDEVMCVMNVKETKPNTRGIATYARNYYTYVYTGWAKKPDCF